MLKFPMQWHPLNAQFVRSGEERVLRWGQLTRAETACDPDQSRSEWSSMLDGEFKSIRPSVSAHLRAGAI